LALSGARVLLSAKVSIEMVGFGVEKVRSEVMPGDGHDVERICCNKKRSGSGFGRKDKGDSRRRSALAMHVVVEVKGNVMGMSYPFGNV
jgi:hypothetical protein